MLRLKVKTFVLIFSFYKFQLSPWTQPLWVLQKISVSALAEPLAQMLRVVGSGLEFCKRRLKYGVLLHLKI